jgi:hypothetical protein
LQSWYLAVCHSKSPTHRSPLKGKGLNVLSGLNGLYELPGKLGRLNGPNGLSGLNGLNALPGKPGRLNGPNALSGLNELNELPGKLGRLNGLNGLKEINGPHVVKGKKERPAQREKTNTGNNYVFLNKATRSHRVALFRHEFC